MISVIERTYGEKLPLSFSTANALEQTIYNETLTIQIENMWLNISTLLRNFLDSFVEDYSLIPSDSLAQMFWLEVASVRQYLVDKNVNTTFYMTYSSNDPRFFNSFNLAKVKIPTTAKQKVAADIEDGIIKYGKDNLEDFNTILQFAMKLYGPNDKHVHILTHHPLDLLSDFNFGYLTLLESNTGAIKTKGAWHTKLNKDDDVYSNIPLNILTLQVFGDGAKQFKALSPKFKKALKAHADKNEWTTLTTHNEARSSLAKSHNADDSELLKLLDTKFN